VTKPIDSSSRDAHASPWATAPKPVTGGSTGFTGNDLWILRLYCSPRRGRKDDRSPQLSKTTPGSGTSTTTTVSRLSISLDSSPFGTSLRQRTCTPTEKTRSPGPGRLTAFTPRPLLIEPNSQTAPLLPISRPSGKLGPHPNASSLLGSFCKTACGPVTDWRAEVGTTIRPVPFADAPWKLRTTSWWIAATRVGSGPRSHAD
jgi:hypothetical protein